MAEMEDKYRITYDSAKELALIVHLPNKQGRFKRSFGKPYSYKPNYDIGKEHEGSRTDFGLINMVSENQAAFTDCQFQRAKKARELYHALGTPSMADFKAIICMNAIKNNPGSLDDINTAEKIFGTDIGQLKGKTTCVKPIPAVSDYIEVPQEILHEQQHVTLCIDTMKINGIPFLTTVSRNIKYWTAEWLPSLDMSAYRSALDQVFSIYSKAGFTITHIHCDNEYCPLQDEMLTKQGITMNFASAQEYVPEAEHNNWVIQEQY
jgi:hypothetical protein